MPRRFFGLKTMASVREHEATSPQKFVSVKSKSGTDSIHHSIFSNDVPEDTKQAVLCELNETEENKAQGIRQLKKFLKKKNQTCAEDDLLVTVLRNCKYDIKKSEARLQKYLKARKTIGMELGKMDFKTITSLLDEMPFGILPYRDIHGRAILYTRSFPRVDQYEPDFIAACGAAMLLFFLALPMISAIGINYIGESKYSSVYEYYTTLKYFRRLMSRLFDIPLRIRSVQIVNENVICRWFYNVVRPILPQKLTGRISFLGLGYEKLHKIYHPDLLPEEFGGTLGPMNDVFYRKEFLELLEKLRAEYEYVTD